MIKGIESLVKRHLALFSSVFALTMSRNHFFLVLQGILTFQTQFENGTEGPSG